MKVMKGHCGSLNENGPHSFMFECLVPVRTIWEGLGVVSMFEELGHGGWALRLQRPMSFP